MGRTIEKIALQKGHEIVLKVDENTESFDITLADVAIDFSIPSVAYSNISTCLKNNVPVLAALQVGWINLKKLQIYVKKIRVVLSMLQTLV